MNTKKNRSRIAWGWLAGLTAATSCLFLAQLAGQTPPAQAPATPAGDASQQAGATKRKDKKKKERKQKESPNENRKK